MAGLPVVDGLLLSLLISGAIRDISTAIMVGIAALSGCGCITLAALMKGSLHRKIKSITKVYAITGVGALNFHYLRLR
jgi:hypothetical protein